MTDRSAAQWPRRADRLIYWRRRAELFDTVDDSPRDGLQDYEAALTERLNGLYG